MYNDEDDEAYDEFDYENSIAELFDDEVIPNGKHPGYMGDATVEEILHNINGQIKTVEVFFKLRCKQIQDTACCTLMLLGPDLVNHY